MKRREGADDEREREREPEKDHLLLLKLPDSVEEVLLQKTWKEEKQEGNEAKKRQDQSVMIRADARRPIPVSFTITSFLRLQNNFLFRENQKKEKQGERHDGR